MDVPEKLKRYMEQPGGVVSGADLAFVSAAQNAARGGTGFGFMQQICEWMWQEYCEWLGLPGGAAWGPESFARERTSLEAQISNLLAACEHMIASVDGSYAQVVEAVGRMKLAVAKAKGETA